MDREAPKQANWSALADLMVIPGDQPQTEWSTSDLAQMLRHQLDLPIGDSPANRTIGELLHDPSPSLKVLEKLKLSAKEGRGSGEGPPPPEISAVLYYGVIAAALVCHQARITKLNDCQIIEGVSWILEQPWIDATTGQLFRRLLTGLQGQIIE